MIRGNASAYAYSRKLTDFSYIAGNYVSYYNIYIDDERKSLKVNIGICMDEPYCNVISGK